MTTQEFLSENRGQVISFFNDDLINSYYYKFEYEPQRYIKQKIAMTIYWAWKGLPVEATLKEIWVYVKAYFDRQKEDNIGQQNETIEYYNTPSRLSNVPSNYRGD